MILRFYGELFLCVGKGRGQTYKILEQVSVAVDKPIKIVKWGGWEILER